MDLLLGDRNNQKGKDALQFIVNMATGRKDLENIMKGELQLKKQNVSWLELCKAPLYINMEISYIMGSSRYFHHYCSRS